jgi:glycosyltransferase involved in cell wall biosynthesis
LFQQLTALDTLDPHVFYGWERVDQSEYDRGFERDVEWDIPLLEGYEYTFVSNTSLDPGTHHFRGLVNPSLIPVIEEWGPDALLVFGWGWQSHLRALVHFQGQVPVFFRGDSTLLDEQPGLRQMVRRGWLWWVYSHVDRALYVGSNNRDYFEAHGLDDSQLSWVPHAIDNGRFADPDGEHEEQAAEWRGQLGISSSAPVVLFAGKLERKKAPDVLLEAFLKLSNESAHFIIVGEGPMESELRGRVREHSQVHFLGFQNQSRMPVVYRLGDVFVLPSRGPGETWGLAVNEAMACGRPVIVSDRVGCAPDLVEEDSTGYVVPAENAPALRDALSKIFDNPERRASMGHRSSQRIAGWSIVRAASRIEAIVSEERL